MVIPPVAPAPVVDETIVVELIVPTPSRSTLPAAPASLVAVEIVAFVVASTPAALRVTSPESVAPAVEVEIVVPLVPPVTAMFPSPANAPSPVEFVLIVMSPFSAVTEAPSIPTARPSRRIEFAPLAEIVEPSCNVSVPTVAAVLLPSTS